MKVILSAAVSMDGYIDDCSPRRLVLSSPEDWDEVYRLRAECDAILVGAETLRRDNPSLRIKDEIMRRERAERGLDPDMVRVAVSGSGILPCGLKFFGSGGCRILFTQNSSVDYDDTEIICSEELSAAFIVTELEKRGIRSLMVEGGSRIISMFLREGMVDRLRLAVAPFMVGECGAPRFSCEGSYPCDSGHRALIEEVHAAGNMSVTQIAFRDISPRTEARDRELLQRAIAISRNCVPSGGCYRVGAVIATLSGDIYEGYTGETAPSNHAEEEAVAKALAAGADLRGAAMYSSMEPCSRRRSKPESCSEIMIRHGFAKAVFALYEPDCFVRCEGALNMRKNGLEVRAITDLGDEVLAINAHIVQKYG